MSINLLITCIGGVLSPQLIDSLKKSLKTDINIIGVDANSSCVGQYFVDHFEVVPLGNHPDYISTMLAISKKYFVNLIIPTSDEEAYALSASKELFLKNNTEIACVSHELIQVFCSKSKTYKLLSELNLPIPDWSEINNINNLLSEAKKLFCKYKNLIIKPSMSRGGRNIFEIDRDNYEAFIKNNFELLKSLTPLILQEKLEGPIYDLDMLANNGEPVAVIARRRVVAENPNLGHMIVENKDLEDLGLDLISKLKLTWLYDCDVMLDSLGKPKIIEINPRQSGSVAISVIAGVPLIEMMIKIYQKIEVATPKIPHGVTIIPYQSLKKT